MEDIIGIRKQIIPPKIDLIRTGQHGYRFTLSSVPDLGQTRPCASYVMKPLTWTLKEVILRRHTPIDYKLYHYVWNRSETERLQT